MSALCRIFLKPQLDAPSSHSQLHDLEEASGETPPEVPGEHMLQICTSRIALVTLACVTLHTVLSITRITFAYVQTAKLLQRMSHLRHKAATSQDDIWLQAASCSAPPIPSHTPQGLPYRVALEGLDRSVLTQLAHMDAHVCAAGGKCIVALPVHV